MTGSRAATGHPGQAEGRLARIPFLSAGHWWEILFDISGPFAGMVHIVDIEQPHDPHNSDVVATGGIWIASERRVEWKPGTVQSAVPQRLLDAATEALARWIETEGARPEPAGTG